MKAAFNFLDLVLLDLELTFQTLLLDMLVEDGGWVAFNVVEINIEPVRQFRLPTVLNVLVVEAVLEAVVKYHEEQDDVDEAGNDKLQLEVLVLVATRPQETFIELC